MYLFLGAVGEIRPRLCKTCVGAAEIHRAEIIMVSVVNQGHFNAEIEKSAFAGRWLDRDDTR